MKIEMKEIGKIRAGRAYAIELDGAYAPGLAPEKLGVFATRTPVRPNGVCVSVAAVSSIDEKKGIVKLWRTDAEDGTPVLDVKPYYHCSEYARDARYPEWCAHWPACYEDSANFAWDKEFLF